MDDTTRSETTSSTTGAVPPKTRNGMSWGLVIGLLLVAFAAGFLWQFYEATTARQELSAARQELELDRLRIQLGQAALAASSGEFETARSQMSSFFTRLQEQAPTMPSQVRAVADDFLTMRDEVITGLSRSNPEYARVLYGMVEELGAALDESRGVVTGGGSRPGGEAAPAGAGRSPTSEGAEADPSG